MSTPISLIEMPKVPLEHILEYLDFRSILILRKVCHDMRHFIDDTKPASCLSRIQIYVHSESIKLNQYHPWSRSSFVNKITKQKMLDNEDFVSVFRKDFNIILRHQMTLLEDFHLSLDYLTPAFLESTVEGRVLESVNETLESMNHPFQVKYLLMKLSSQKDIMSILPYIDPKSLERIDICGTLGCLLNLDEIRRLEQWKQAKELEVEGFQIPDLSQNVRHFSKIIFWSLNIPAERIVLLKEIFLCSSTLNSIRVFESYSFDSVVRQGLIEAFGEPYEIKYWFFRIPDTNQLLRISCEYTNICFYRIEQSDVPQNARISN